MNASVRLTEATIQRYASESSFLRGREYYEENAVVDIAWQGSALIARVQGSNFRPYRVRVTLTPGTLDDAGCDCPYEYSGHCKHIVAALLTYIHEPDRVEERPTIESMLAELDRDQLQDILLKLAQRHPDLSEFIENLAPKAGTVLEHASSGVEKPETPPQTINPRSIRRRVIASLHSLDYMRPSEAYWQVGGVVGEVQGVLDEATAALNAGDGDNALIILEALTDEYVTGWFELDDSDGEAGDFFAQLGRAWTEALLTVELTPDRRQGWADQLAAWQKDVSDYGIEEAFDAARAAALQGWDALPIEEVESEEISDEEDEYRQEPVSWFADDLARAKLNVLERQGRTEEYLDLARSEGQTEQYTMMLVKIGRIAEAVDHGLTHLQDADELLELCRALWNRGETESALRIGEHGLNVSGSATQLGRWLRDVAISVERDDLALRAGIAAFRDSIDLLDYQALEPLAGSRWPQIKDELLEYLAAAHRGSASIGVYLHEGMVEEAIKIVDDSPYISFGKLELVVDAAIERYSDWAIDQSNRQANSIMDAGKSGSYHHAVRWLGKARAAYLSAGRETEWKTLLENLLDRHRRKYSLVPRLETLR